MSKNGDVLFPEDYDVRSFFSDIGLQDKSILVNHGRYMKGKSYKVASSMLEASDHEYYGAYLFNALEGRINKIGEYEQAQQIIHPYYQTEKPNQSEYYDNMVWISGTEITNP